MVNQSPLRRAPPRRNRRSIHKRNVTHLRVVVSGGDGGGGGVGVGVGVGV